MGFGEFADIVIGSGGYAANLYFTATASTIETSYCQLSYDAGDTEVEKSAVCNNGETLLDTCMIDTPLYTTSIDSGLWNASFYAKVSSRAATTYIRAEVFTRTDAGVETTLFSTYSNLIDDTDYARVLLETTQPSFDCSGDSYLGVRLYAYTTSSSDKTVTFVKGDGNASYMNTPLSLRHSQLRDKNGEDDYQHITQTQKDKLDNTIRTYTTMPTASADNVGDTIQYLGSTTASSYILMVLME